MKLEKFDYQIGNKKTKKEFVALGVLCIALVVVVVLYKTFASFSSNASFSIVGATVGVTEENRVAVMDPVNISKTENDEVYATLYDDGTLSISGTGYMKDFEGIDLIGEVLDAYIAAKVSFTSDEQALIDANRKFIGTMFDYAGRSFLTRDDLQLESQISQQFSDSSDQELVKSIMNKVSASGFDIDTIEIIGNVKNIGENAFSLMHATENSDVRENIYGLIYISWDYTCNTNATQLFSLFKFDATMDDIDAVGDNAMLDIRAQNIDIGENATILPNDIFASYNGGELMFPGNCPYSTKTVNHNLTLTIPDNIEQIGRNAFYAYNGESLTLPANLRSIGDYAFANYYGSDVTVPMNPNANGVVMGTGVFRDFTGNIHLSVNCPTSNAFAPNAKIYNLNNTMCNYN